MALDEGHTRFVRLNVPVEIVPVPHLPFPSRRSILLPVKITVAQVADQLTRSYVKLGGINHLDGKNLPSKSGIVAITVDLLRLLYPGFFDERIIHSSELKSELLPLLESVAARLEDEITRSLEYAAPAGQPRKNLRPAARELTREFLGVLPAIRELLRTDAEAAYSGDPAAQIGRAHV